MDALPMETVGTWQRRDGDMDSAKVCAVMIEGWIAKNDKGDILWPRSGMVYKSKAQAEASIRNRREILYSSGHNWKIVKVRLIEE